MKVGLIVPGGVDRSGTERTIPVLLWLIERLARVHDLHIFALRQEPRPATYPLLGATVQNIGLRPRRMRTLNAIKREHARGSFDVLHALWAVPQGVIGAVAARMLGVPLLLEVIGGDLVSLADIDYGNARTRRGRAWLTFAVHTAARAITASAFMQELARGYGLELERLPLGVALDRWPRTPPRTARQHPTRLLHVGSINRVKDQEMLLRAAQALRARDCAFQLDLVGTDTLSGRLQSTVDALGLSDCVRFHGHIPQEELPAFYQAADLLIVSSRHESGPVVALEAAVCGLPVVGTAVGFIADWAPRAALAVPAGDAQALAAGIMSVLADDALRVTLAREAQQIALRENADWSAAQVNRLYEELRNTARRKSSLTA